ncbi:MAG: Glyoxalase/bleomycin resistance protein/dioxygenase [Solirubrobacterales bacterium]|nr:Glyoxalase/bleomycin resistance protein/dioxygenase [Solirubrobacterales bacterium]
MGERTGYAPGTFCWTDLTTTDQPAAKQFYGALFGWEAEDLPVGDGVSYSMMRLRGKDVAAISPQPPQQREAGAPPAWNSYVSVEDADAAVERAKVLGGSAHLPAFDVMEAGRMGVLQDPQGAYFMVWQPRNHFGAALVNEPGALSWDELATPDLDAAAAFYGELFGWNIEPVDDSPQRYLMIKNGERNNGGMREPEPPDVPPHWLVYFGAEDIDAALARVGELGGTTLAGPIDIGMAKIGIVQDPQGATFALYDGAFEP